MQNSVILVCLIITVVLALYCAMTPHLLKAAVALAVLSAVTSVILFLFGATWAALFELSVCVGLVTVIFAVSINLTAPHTPEPEAGPESTRRFSMLPLLLIFSGVLLLIIMIFTNFSLSAITVSNATVETFRDVFWSARQADILGQIILILVGALAIVILFKESDKA